MRLSGKDSAAYHGDTEDKEHSFQPHGWWRRRNTDGTEIFNLFSVSTAPPNALTLMEHLLHLSLPGSGHPKHGGRRHSFTVPVLDTVSLAVAVPWGQPGEGNCERDSPESPKGQSGSRCPSREPLQPLESPCWGRYLHCSSAGAHAGAGYALKEVQPMGRTHYWSRFVRKDCSSQKAHTEPWEKCAEEG